MERTLQDINCKIVNFNRMPDTIQLAPVGFACARAAEMLYCARNKF
jgi:hypothetical protein